jgi:hypothetical protein
MKYAIITCINRNFVVSAEHIHHEEPVNEG